MKFTHEYKIIRTRISNSLPDNRDKLLAALNDKWKIISNTTIGGYDRNQAEYVLMRGKIED